ncbi:ALF repeat-containing protein [Streptomyces globisporus]|uniref:ALF repeat-containing protein n=1 Tax=Streptomyces globisporus TaxID=1908 RepID=UPI0036FB751A
MASRRFSRPGRRRLIRSALRTLVLGLLPLALACGLLGAAPVSATEPERTTERIAALAEATPSDRGRAVDYWVEGGPGVKAAAEAALTGTDAELQAFLTAADDIEIQDKRVSAAQIASVGGTELLTAARTALAGSREELEIFLSWGWEAPMRQDDRVQVAQVISAGGLAVQDAGRAALAGSADDVAAFLEEGQFAQRKQDERVQLVQVLSVGGTNVRAAGRLALNGTAEDIREFLEVGQFVARVKDQEHATVAQLAALAQEAGRQAAKETVAAKSESDKAVKAAELANEPR